MNARRVGVKWALDLVACKQRRRRKIPGEFRDEGEEEFRSQRGGYVSLWDTKNEHTRVRTGFPGRQGCQYRIVVYQ